MDKARSLETRLEASETEDAKDLLTRYRATKQYLAQQYYPWIQANCPFYTDHGERHVEGVIRSASELLKDARDMDDLSIYLLLMGIIWHDAGMVRQRTGHSDISEMIEKIKEITFPNATVQRLLAQIALAHTGQDGLSKAEYEQDCSTSGGNYQLRPRALASVVRFADEISENRSRISHELLRDGAIPPNNLLYWEYANCIAASRADPGRARVVVTIEVDREKSCCSHSCPPECLEDTGLENSITLIEYTVYRLQKMYNELRYCSQDFRTYTSIDDIHVRLKLLEGITPIDGYGDSFDMSDLAGSSYPRMLAFDKFFERFPRWKPGIIQGA